VIVSIQPTGLRHLIVACAASLSLACSSSSPAPAGTGPVDAAGESDATTTTPPTDAGTPEPDTGTTPPADTGTSTGEAGPAALSCTSYCAAIMSACTGPNAQYGSTDDCMHACPNFPVGMAGDTSGNTLGCRTTHAMLAASATNPHCWHAGPYGYGACGDECAGFCTLATTWCTPAGGFDGGAPPYASESACLTSCAGYKQIDAADGGLGLDGGYNAQGPAGGNTLDCREYHLGASLAGGAMQQLHCQHPGMTSATCM
jgi:hypothetical protein